MNIDSSTHENIMENIAMPAIVQFPTIVNQALKEFGPHFANEPERKHFAEYLTGLIIANNKNVSAINREFAVTTDQSCLKLAKSEAGLSDYEVRTWIGWHHHQILSLIGLWFLIVETRRGKKYTPALTVPQVRTSLYVLLRHACDRRYPGWAERFVKRKAERRELARFSHYKRHKLLAPLRLRERK